MKQFFQNSAQVPIRIKPYYVFAFPCGHKKSYVRSSSTVPPTDNSRAIVTLRPLGRRNCKSLKYSCKYLLECISRGDKALSKGTLKWVSKSNSLRTARGRHRDSRSSSKCQMSTRKKGQCQRNIFANSSQNAWLLWCPCLQHSKWRTESWNNVSVILSSII